VSPEGEEFVVHGNLSEFCRERNLEPSAFTMICKGKRKTHKGWRAMYIDNK